MTIGNGSVQRIKSSNDFQNLFHVFANAPFPSQDNTWKCRNPELNKKKGRLVRIETNSI